MVREDFRLKVGLLPIPGLDPLAHVWHVLGISGLIVCPTLVARVAAVVVAEARIMLLEGVGPSSVYSRL